MHKEKPVLTVSVSLIISYSNRMILMSYEYTYKVKFDILPNIRRTRTTIDLDLE